jgi:hypothetical protein
MDLIGAQRSSRYTRGDIVDGTEGGAMAQAMMLVCDVCGKPDATTVTIRVGERNLQKDYCAKHLAELIQGARAPKRGRRPGSVAKAAPARRKTTKKKAAGRRPRTAAKRA